MAKPSGKTKRIQLKRAMTWGGVNYAPGSVEMPEEAAAYAVKKNFGSVSGGKSGSNVPEAGADFKPLDREETMKRFMDGDDSDEVFQSLRFHQQALIQEQTARSSKSDLVEGRQGKGSGGPDANASLGGNANASNEPDGNENDGSEGENTGGKDGLPDDFPMRHVFEAPNILSATGFKTVADIQAFSREKLIEIDGIAEKTADKALAYGK